MVARYPAVLLGILVLLAGCQGALSGFDGGLTPSVEEGASGSPTPTPAVEIMAPGIEGSGTVDAERLAAAHADALQGRSYTVRMRWQVVFPEGTGTRASVIKVDPAHERFVYVSRVVERFPEPYRGQPTVHAFSDGEWTYLRFVEDNRTEYRRYEAGTSTIPAENDGGSYIRAAFDDMPPADVTQVTYRGWIAYRLSATNGSGPERAEVSAIVDTFGLVYELNASAPAGVAYDGTAERIRYRRRYTDIGNTSIRRPAWVADATAALEIENTTDSVDINDVLPTSPDGEPAQ